MPAGIVGGTLKKIAGYLKYAQGEEPYRYCNLRRTPVHTSQTKVVLVKIDRTDAHTSGCARPQVEIIWPLEVTRRLRLGVGRSLWYAVFWMTGRKYVLIVH